MLRHFFTTMALTAAMTAGTDLTSSEAQSPLSWTTNLAEVPLQSPASLALAQTSTEAGMFERRVGQITPAEVNNFL